jgi:hypothetical protein
MMDKKDNTDDKGKMYYVAWVVGISFVITGINIFQNSGIAGILYILAGSVLIPEVNSAIHKKWNIDIPVWLRITLFIVIIIFISNINAQESATSDESGLDK